MPDSDKPRNRALEREIATIGGGRDITRGYVDQLHYLLPQDSILQLRGGYNYELYRDLMRDDQVAAVFTQRRLALVAKPTRVVAGGDRRLDKRAAEMIEATLDHIRWDTVTDRMLYGRFYGYAVAECLWKRDGARVVLDRIKVRDRRRFVFGPDFRPRLLTATNPNGERLPAQKFWWLSTGADHDDEPYGLGLGHWLYWPVLFKRGQITFWLAWADKFGSPTVIGKYPPGSSDEDKRLVHGAGKAVAHESTVSIPEHLQIELLEAARTGHRSYAELYDRLNAAISKVVIGQTMTADDGASRSQGEVHLTVRDDIVAADARLICDSFNRSVVKWLVDWNFPGAAYPRVERDLDDAPDLKAQAERDEIIIRMMGKRPDTAYIHETYGLDLVDDPADADDNPNATPAPEQAALAEPDDKPLARQTREVLGPKVDAWVAGLAAQASQARSLTAYRDWLDDHAPAALDTGDLADALGEALVIATLTGWDDAAAPVDIDAAASVDLADEDGAYLPFARQIDFLRAKLDLPTRAWTDIWQSQHDVAFVVAGAAKTDLVSDLHQAVDAAIAEGETIESFRERFDAIAEQHGWSYNGGRDWRTRVIYETNLRTSYAAGRWEQLQATKALRPYWRYRHSPAVVDPRPEHLAWDGLVLRADDPWWRTHAPPNGWGCQGYIESLSERDMARLGKDGPDSAPPLDRREVTVGIRGPSPRTVNVPAGIDPGFAYAPGRTSQLSRAVRHQLEASLPQSAPIASAGVADTLAAPRTLDALRDEWHDWRRGSGNAGEAFSLGAIPPATVRALAQLPAPVELQTALVTLARRDLTHLTRESKRQRGAVLADTDLDRLPDIIAAPKATLWDTQDPALLFVFEPTSDAAAGKLVVRVNYSERLQLGGKPRQTVTSNAVRTAGYVRIDNLREDRYVLLEGALDE